MFYIPFFQASDSFVTDTLMACASIRDVLRNILRPPVPKEYPGATWEPGDPHTIWKNTTPAPDLLSLPSPHLLERLVPNQCAGRVIRLETGWPNQQQATYAMLSLRSQIKRVPPHPGIRPSELSEWAHPYITTSDGTHGLYESSRYPQVFDHRRPWLGFHQFNAPPSSRPVSIQNPVEYFDFSGVGDDLDGGNWIQPKLLRLLQYRDEAEENLVRALKSIGDPRGEVLCTHFGPSLPFFNKWQGPDQTRWTCWTVGRHTVAHTSRYINELGAIARWIHEISRQRRQPGRPASVDSSLQGMWIGTIKREEDWAFVLNSPIPLFGLFVLSPQHPLYTQAQPGTLDNDEFF